MEELTGKERESAERAERHSGEKITKTITMHLMECMGGERKKLKKKASDKIKGKVAV